MNLRGLFGWLTSPRVTISLLCALAVLLLMNVALPQEATLGPEEFGRLIEASPVARFFLATLGLGRMPTSPVFLAALGLFLVNLLAVLASRVGPTLRRASLKPRSEKGLQAWARLEEARSAAVSSPWSAGLVARTLRGFGYQVRKPGEKTLWGVKHRTAPIGFLLFHISFFLLFAGGVAVYYTRFVGTAILSEGQEFTGQYSEILRQRPVGAPPDLAFALESVVPRFERGEAVYLGATFRFRQAGTTVSRTSSVNHPARWGSAIILVKRSGLAPVLWLQDDRGFTVDRIVVPTRTRGPALTDVTLRDDRTTVFVQPLEQRDEFPDREELLTQEMTIQVTRDGRVVFDGELRPGESASFEGGRLVLEEIRYWVGINVVSERGGGLLIAGFVIGTVGLIWRLLWYRREVVVTWDEERFHLVGRSEYFSGRFQDELAAIEENLATAAQVDDAVSAGDAEG